MLADADAEAQRGDVTSYFMQPTSDQAGFWPGTLPTMPPHCCGPQGSAAKGEDRFLFYFLGMK